MTATVFYYDGARERARVCMEINQKEDASENFEDIFEAGRTCPSDWCQSYLGLATAINLFPENLCITKSRKTLLGVEN